MVWDLAVPEPTLVPDLFLDMELAHSCSLLTVCGDGSCFNRLFLAKIRLKSNVDGSNVTLKTENKTF